MANIINVNKNCNFTQKFVLFDTNIWLFIYGNNPDRRSQIYSDFYDKILKNGNTVIVNEQIISEFYNRFCKQEFDALFPDKDNRPSFKIARKTDRDLMDAIQTIERICLEILDSCQYQQSNINEKIIIDNLHIASSGALDLTDATLVSECVSGDFVLMSDDGDFSHSDITLATGNRQVLRASAV